MANSTLSISRLLEGGLVTPLTLSQDWFPLQGRTIALNNLNYNNALHYHSSAILASVVDTISLLYRQKDKMASLADVISCLSRGSRCVAAVSAQFPLDFQELGQFEKDIFTQMTPLIPSASISSCKDKSPPPSPYQALFTLRGIFAPSIYTKRSVDYKAASNPEEYLEACITQQLNQCRSRMYCHAKPLQTTKPFPHIFTSNISTEGYSTGVERRAGEGVNMAPLLTSWNAGPAVANSLACLASKSAKLSYGKLPRFLDCGTEQEEWAEAVEKIQTLADNYADEDI